jgi:hypothetical protein
MITTFVQAGFKVVCVVDSLRHPKTGKPLQMDVLFARD